MDSQHQNPLNRIVTAVVDENFGLVYEREKYKEMLLMLAETTLGFLVLTGHYTVDQKTRSGGYNTKRNERHLL